MMAVELVLILGLLVSAHCEVRARDPEVEEEEELEKRTASGGRGAAPIPPFLGGLGVTEPPPQHEGRKYPTRNGYKLSTRPIYRQQEKTVTDLEWRCCPGHGGQNCQDKVPDAQHDSGQSAPIGRPEGKDVHPGLLERLRHHVDPNIEQNDHHISTSELHDTEGPENPHQIPRTTLYPGHAESPLNVLYHPANIHQEHPHPLPHRPADTPYPEAPAALPVPHMMALVMSQLQPILEGFNRSLEHLSQQVRDLARDVAQLQGNQPSVAQAVQLQFSPTEDPEFEETAEEQLETKLDEVYQHIRLVERQLENQQIYMENQLHSQHAMLHYNLTTFKTDIDMKLKRHHKMLQMSLQDMNATLAELKLEKDQTSGDPLDDQPPPHNPPQPTDTSALWEAIERLDNMVINNTVKVDGLMEDMEVTSGNVQLLKLEFKELEKQINQTARNSQVLFMETGLEVQAGRAAVLKQVDQLAKELSKHGRDLEEVADDADKMYVLIHNISASCDCERLKAAVAQLETGMASVTEQVNENRLALNANGERGPRLWGSTSDWEPAVEALQHGLQQVKESLATEQNKTRTLEHSLKQLSSSVSFQQTEISGLNEVDKNLKDDMERLSESFSSLLNDGIRHSQVLELLLEEEVPEFLEWPVLDQEAHSIPALKEQLSHLQDQLTQYNLSLISLLNNRTGHRDEVPSADQPSSSHLEDDTWLSGNPRKSSSGVPARERQLLHPAGRQIKHKGDGSDLWNLEKTVQQLELQVVRLEEKCQAATEVKVSPNVPDDKLQAEVTWLKRGLEEHLRVFKNVFSNADVLAESDATLELDKLWQFVKNKDGKKDKKRRGSNHRSRRDLYGDFPVSSGLSEDSLLVAAGSPVSVLNGVINFKASLNRGQYYSDTGTFTAPASGIYLFVLTLDLHLGPTHLFLRKESGVAPVSLHQQRVTEAGPVTSVGLLPLSEGEEVRLELRGRVRGRSEDNVLTVILLHQNT